MAPAALLLMAPRRARGWHRIVFGAALCIAIGWQWSWPISDVTKAAGDRTNHQRFFAPMIDAIRADANVSGTSAPRGGRVEVVPLRSKADADWVAREFPLARGWDRQVDRRDNANLYRQLVTSADYRSWLDDHAVTYVAVPSGALDEGGRGETALLASPPDYLVEMFTSADWRVFRVTNAVPIVASVDGVAADAVDGAVSVGVDSLTFVATQPNSQVSVRINDSRWLHVDRSTSGDACVATHADHMVTLRIRRPGQITLRVSLATSTNC